MNGIIFLCYRTLILISIGFCGVCVKAQIIEKYNVETQNKDTIKVIPEVVIQKNKNKSKNIGLRSKSQKIVFYKKNSDIRHEKIVREAFEKLISYLPK